MQTLTNRQFQVQPYLTYITFDMLRIALTKLSLSAHRLKIETGRWRSKTNPINDRKCKVFVGTKSKTSFILF